MAKKKAIRRETYPYGYLDLHENIIVVFPASYATEEQVESLMKDARMYAALATKPVRIHVSHKDSG